MKKPFKGIDTSIIFLGVIFIIGIFFFIKSNIDFTNANHKVKFFPLVLSLSIIILCILEFMQNRIKRLKKNAESKVTEEESNINDQAQKAIIAFIWLTFIPVISYILGFYISIPLFAFLFLRYKKKNWRITIIITTVMFCVVFFGFKMLLRMQLYSGVFLKYHFN